MSIHRVSQGECLSSIAKQYGFRDWKTIYNHASNQAFRAKRPNPNLIYPGDEINIPEPEKKQAGKPVDQKHKFKVKGRRTHLRLLIEDFEGTAVGGKSYQLEVGTEVFTGTTGGDGLVEQEIPVDAGDGEITVWLDSAKTTALYWPLKIGSLDPHDEAPGAHERLNNLGYDNLADSAADDRSTAAIKAFQKKNGITESGTIDEATKNKAKEVFGF